MTAVAMFRQACLFLIPIIFGGCVSATLREPDICLRNFLGTVPANESSILIHKTFSVQLDFSKPARKISKVSNHLNSTITKLLVKSNVTMSWAMRVNVTIKGIGKDTPEIDFGTFFPNSGNSQNEINMKVRIDSTTLFEYLQNPIILTFDFTGTTPVVRTSLEYEICMDLTGEIDEIQFDR